MPPEAQNHRTLRQFRLLNRDGSFNIERAGVKRRVFNDLYHSLLASTWPRFFLLFFACYLAANVVFGSIYYTFGPDALEGIRRGTGFEHWLDCFFFSVQTLATIGYGRISPVSLGANLLVTVEALFGMLTIAVGSGLLFARFSRPTARVVFSDKALIATVDEEPLLMFRMANARLNQIVEAQVGVILLITEKTAEGQTFRNLYDLKLERSRSPVFALSWVIAHPIDDSSPLKGMTLEQMRENEIEIFVSVTGIDDTLSQTIHARYSYTADDILENRYFADVLERTPEQKVRLHIDRINALQEAAQNL